MTPGRRAEIETRLANYNLPLQILQMVADRSECSIYSSDKSRKVPKQAKILDLLAGLNDKAILMLEQIFLECHDSFSSFRFAVFLSSKYSPITHKYVMDAKVSIRPDLEYTFDICIYSRDSGRLVAVGLQNHDTKHAASNDSLQKFIAAVNDLRRIGIRGAYYSSSYGYADSERWRLASKAFTGVESADVRFFEYREKVYFEIKPK